MSIFAATLPNEHYYHPNRNSFVHKPSIYTIGIILLGIVVFVFLGLAGWVLKAFGWVFEFLEEGCSTSVGCIFWVIVVILLLIVLGS